MKYLLSISLLILLLVRPAHAEQSAFQGYIVIPSDTKTAKAIMQVPEPDQKALESGPKQGIRLITPNAGISLKDVARWNLEAYKLEWGSIFVRARKEAGLAIGPLFLEHREDAEFLAFVSGDAKEVVIKMLKGEPISVSHPETEQKALLRPSEAVSLSVNGELLAPYPFNPKELNPWWESPVYNQDYERVPVAIAGPDQRLPIRTHVRLDGSASQHYQKGDIFEWSIESGQKVVFESESIVEPRFFASEEGEYEIALRITNGQGKKSNQSRVKIFVGAKYLEPDDFFADVPKAHPDNIAVSALRKKGAVKGSLEKDGTVLFLPHQKVNRAAFLKMLYVNMGRSEEPKMDLVPEKLPFSDLNTSMWYTPYAVMAEREGVVKGIDGRFMAEKEVSLAEALTMATRAMNFSLTAFKKSQNEAWYEPAMSFARVYSIVSEVQPDPSHSLTRAEVARLLFRMDAVKDGAVEATLSGVLKSRKTALGIPGAKVFVYKTERDAKALSGWKQSSVFKTLETDVTGAFSVKLPRDRVYMINAITPGNVSSSELFTEPKQIILEVDE